MRDDKPRPEPSYGVRFDYPPRRPLGIKKAGGRLFRWLVAVWLRMSDLVYVRDKRKVKRQ